MTKDQIINEVKAMDPHQRAELMEDLRQFIPDEELTPEQIAEVHRRIERIDRGEVELIPGEQVMREIRQRYGKQ